MKTSRVTIRSTQHHRHPVTTSPAIRRQLPLWMLLFFILLMLIGLHLGEPARILEQARTVCMACIGIG